MPIQQPPKPKQIHKNTEVIKIYIYMFGMKIFYLHKTKKIQKILFLLVLQF